MKTKKIIAPRETVELETGSITLMPAKFVHFDTLTGIINKYFYSFNQAINEYAEKRAKVIAEHSDPKMRADALAYFENDNDVSYNIAQSILECGSDAADDARSLITACIDEKKGINVDLEDLTVVEILILVGTAIGLNLNFFNQNQDRMGLKTILKTEEKKPNSGTKSLAA